MVSRPMVLSLTTFLALVLLPGCNNALNPFCGNSRPAPLISSLVPSTMTFSEVQQGSTLTINGGQFGPSSQVVINGKTLFPTIVSSQQLKVMITTSLISGPGKVNVSVHTPEGNSGDVGCSSGGTSSALVLTVD
jgi:IPT/TIG domain